MQCDVLPISDLGQRDLAAWSQLGAAAVSPNPFMEPDFVLPATRAWGVNDVGVLVVRDGADWLAAVPVRSTRSWRSVPGRCLAAWRHTYCYLGTPLVVDIDAEATLAALIRRGLQVSDCFALDWIDGDGPLAEPLHSVLASETRPVVVEEFERPALYRRPSERPELSMSSRTRGGYRRKLRLLEREVGELTVSDRSDDPAAYQRFLELERDGWRGTIGTAMACIPGHGAFFTEICERFSRSGRLRLLSLQSEQRTIAMKSDLIAGAAIFFFKPVFDEEFARFSPGVQLEIANVESFDAGEWTVFDSCTAPDNVMYNKLWPGRRRLRSVVATAPGLAGALPYAKWRAAAAALPIRRKLTRSQTGRTED